MALLTLVQGNTKPRVNFTVKDPAGNPVNLAGATVKLILRKIGASALKLNVNCTLTVPASGTCHYDWAQGDLNDPGDYHGELEVHFPAGEIQTTNLMGFQVRPALPS